MLWSWLSLAQDPGQTAMTLLESLINLGAWGDSVRPELPLRFGVTASETEKCESSKAAGTSAGAVKTTTFPGNRGGCPLPGWCCRLWD